MHTPMAHIAEAAMLGTLGEVAAYHAARNPSVPALQFEGRRTTYGELHAQSDAVARALRATGIAPGDRVVYLGKNSDRYFELLFGAAKSGAVLIPLGWRLSPAEAAFIINDSEARLLVVGPDAGEQFTGAFPLLRVKPTIVFVDGGYETWREVAAADDLLHVAMPDDVLIQLYTSGTTGMPKGVMLTHMNLQAGKRFPPDRLLAWSQWCADDIFVNAMPVSHIAGTNWGLIGLVAGAMTTILREFSPQGILRAINEGATQLFLVPAALRLVLEHPAARTTDYSRLRHVLYGASPIPLELLRECVEVFGAGFCQQYGMTETAGTVVFLPPQDHGTIATDRMRSAGIPMPGVELKIVDEEGAAVAVGGTGEILIRSPMNMAGYWKREAETANAVDADGWLRTGDAGLIDADGYLYIQDRVKDMIISGGENIYPAEIESVLFAHPAVADVAVIGVPDARWGEAVKAVVVLKPGMNASVEEILGFANDNIARFKAPKSIDFVDHLPRNASGKILRRELRAPYWPQGGPQIN